MTAAKLAGLDGQVLEVPRVLVAQMGDAIELDRFDQAVSVYATTGDDGVARVCLSMIPGRADRTGLCSVMTLEEWDKFLHMVTDVVIAVMPALDETKQ